MEEIAKRIIEVLSICIELIAAGIIGVALIQLILTYVPFIHKRNHHINNSFIRVRFGTSLALSLELLLAADILITAIAPTWDDIGKLGAIAAIRTALNYFLEKELQNTEKRM